MAFEIRSRVAFFFPLLSSENLWGSHSKNLISFSRCLFLTGNISHRCSDFPNLKGGGGGGLNCTPNYAQKKTKQNKNKTKISIDWTIKQLKNSVFSECACTYSPDYVILCAVEDARAILRNHLRENVSLLCLKESVGTELLSFSHTLWIKKHCP